MSLKTFVYQIQPEAFGRMESGELEANSIDDAKRQLRVKYLLSKLPSNTEILDKSSEDEARAAAKSAKARELLRVLASHHEWLSDPETGERANLANLNLSGISMPGANLRNADLPGTDLSDTDLTKSDLSSANLVRASLQNANLKNADLRNADLSDSDLRGADLTGAQLDGVDLWRANLQGCTISPTALHKALACKKA
ncbi:pentapeptide repeat-containing protein [Kiloniella sp. b19]|uniref:pentapeptide repeat-containing protein n=1 Tax=Kiloniella sp. GXU_MW_B19 TaxID=3141326 RepID=UPI0031D78C4D